MKVYKVNAIDFENIKKNVKKQVEDDLAILHTLELPTIKRIINFDPLHPIFLEKPKLIQSHYNLPSSDHQIIYIFSIKTLLNQDEFSNFIGHLKSFKTNQNDGYTQITTAKSNGIKNYPIGRANAVVYVGTSKSIASRLQQHVGHGSKNTATIMLRKWLEFKDKNLQIEFSYFDFGKKVNPDLIKRIEHQLSIQLNPLLGHNRRA